MAQHCLFVCAGILHVYRLCMCMYPYNLSVCIKVYSLSFPSAVRMPGSIQHLDQQVSPSCTSTLTHSTDLHSPAEGEATQLLTFPRLRMQSHTVSSYCNREPAVFHHVQQSTNSVLESRVALYRPCIVLLCFSCCIMHSDRVAFILEDQISPHRLLKDAWCPDVAGSLLTRPPEG